MQDWSELSSKFPYLKHFQSICPSLVIITKLLSNRTIKKFPEELKEMLKFFKTDEQIFKNL